MRKYLILPVLLISAAGIFAESAISVSPVRWDEAEAKADALLAQMTDEEKVGQMIQAERRYMKISDITKYCLGSVLSGGGSAPGKNTVDDWRTMIEKMQAAAAKTRLAIPIIYGVDAVHGHNNLAGAVIFPHNSGLGASASTQGTFEAARETARAIRGLSLRVWRRHRISAGGGLTKVFPKILRKRPLSESRPCGDCMTAAPFRVSSTLPATEEPSSERQKRRPDFWIKAMCGSPKRNSSVSIWSNTKKRLKTER